MSTETQKRKQTMTVLDQLKMPPPRQAKYRNDWTGEDLPQAEEGAQANYDQDIASRAKQDTYNRTQGGSITEPVFNAVQSALGQEQTGPTGMGGGQITPYSPEYNEQRSLNKPVSNDTLRTGVEALDQPPASKRKKKKPIEDADKPDDSAPVSGGY